MTSKNRPTGRPQRAPIRRRIWLLAFGFLLVEVAVLPGADSPFRTPKAVLALALLLAVAGLSLVGRIRSGSVTLRWSPLATVLALLPLLQGVSAFWAGSPVLAVTAATGTAIWVLGAVWLATASGAERMTVIHGAAIGAAVSALVLMTQAAGLAIFSIDPAGPTGRLTLTGMTGNPADLALAAVLLLPLVLAGPDASSRPVLRWILAAVLTAAAVVSQTLTALLALALVWGAWLIQQRSRKLWIGAAITSVLAITAGLAGGLDERVAHQIRRLRHGDWYFLLSARSDGWSAATEMIRARPALGVGAANFTHAYYPSRLSWLDRTGTIGRRAELATHFRFAHCEPLQMLAELGIPGLVWMIAFIVVGFLCRPRGDPLVPLFAAALAPFALLHFPAHLAVGLIPIVLALAHGLSGGAEMTFEPKGVARFALAGAGALMVLAGCYEQVHALMLNLWRGGLTHALTASYDLDPQRRALQAAAVETEILPRLAGLPSARPWLWRMVGQARIARGDDVGAETAFRNAMELWPHEEAEFGLGLALAAQDRRLSAEGRTLDSRNRRGEALVHLARVCRTNPALLELIEDVDLRRAATEIVEAEVGSR